MPYATHGQEMPFSKILIGGVATTLVVTLTGTLYWHLTRPSSYDECLVSEMRGQSQSMFWVVSKMCGRRFRREVDVPTSLLGRQIDFMYLPDFKADPEMSLMGSRKLSALPVHITIKKNDSEYELTRVRFRQAYKFTLECHKLQDEDWTQEYEATFKGSLAVVSVRTQWDSKDQIYIFPQCTHWTRIWGIER
jgi:hypothetical protein